MFFRTLFAAAAMFVLAASSAHADPYEPNEKITDPTTPLEAGKQYTGTIDNLGDDDYYLVKGSGPVTAQATVVSDACPDDTPALRMVLHPYDTAFGDSSAQLDGGETKTVTLTMEKGKEYRLLFQTYSGRDITACSDTRVEYAFSLSGAVDDGKPSGPSGPVRVTGKPKLRRYACLHQSQGYTGFGEPAFRFRLRSSAWDDLTTAKKVTARWSFRDGLTTLFSKKGRRLYRFAQFKDSRGRYLVEHPRGKDPLICR